MKRFVHKPLSTVATFQYKVISKILVNIYREINLYISSKSTGLHLAFKGYSLSHQVYLHNFVH